MDQPTGAFCLVLHSHLPYVLDHGTWPHGADMLYEAAAETYLPLLNALETLVQEGHSPALTIGITPVVAEQLADERFKQRFADYLRMRIGFANDNAQEFDWHGRDHLKWLAERWRGHCEWLLRMFEERYQGDLVGAFARLQEDGHIEILTSAATHAYLPLLLEEVSIEAQVKQGAQTHERLFGRRPRGFWLPECAYRPAGEWQPPEAITGEVWEPRYRVGLEDVLGRNGIDYFIVDSHALGGTAEPVPVYVSWQDTLGKLWGKIARLREPLGYNGERTPYAPYFVGGRFEHHPPVAAFIRDPRTGLQVWSKDLGYPGDGWYLDFHKKHFPGGHRYWRVTDASGDLGAKQEYDPGMAADRVQDNASHFVSLVKSVLAENPRPDGQSPVLCAPFDAELFGHWWYEGPHWLETVTRWLSDAPEVALMTCGDYLGRHSPTSVVNLPEGSWGQGGGHWVWLNEWTDWIWKREYDAEVTMRWLALDHWETADEPTRELIRQAARELFLLQSSDWQFLISTWTARDYAEARANGHHSDFSRIADLARRQASGQMLSPEEQAYVQELRQRDNVFPDLDPGWFVTA
ncbi:MAG: 1,4-alpha-glucan branching protein domain-containing protein [Armatimonadota bacterium]